MNISVPVSWLREYLKTDVAAKTIANYLSLSGPSVERIEKHKEDYIFDVEITTNRFDAASIFGLAREAFAILKSENEKAELTSPKGLNYQIQPETRNQSQVDVLIKDKTLCPRFTAVVVDNVKIHASPAIIRNRLEASGVRSLNNIIDITNYIMLELGQPMHAFDFDKITDGKMILRESRDGEKITTLDGKKHILPQGTIVIESEGKLIDLCGIMGAENSQITRRTKRVLLFAQSYDPIRIRKTTQALAFRTDAAARFEKGVDVEAIPKALSRSVYLAKQITGARVASEVVDILSIKPVSKSITLDLNKLESYMGFILQKKKVIKILESLGFSIKSQDKFIRAIPPTWRAHDTEDDVDLIEEVARIFGYHRIPSSLPQGKMPNEKESEFETIIKLKRDLKIIGLTEVISYSIISKNLLKLSETPKNKIVELANPLTEEWQFMRPTMIPSLAQVVAQNQHIDNNQKLFEIARIYLKKKKGLPDQPHILAIALLNSNFYEAKGFVENIFKIMGRDFKITKLRGKNLIEQNQSAAITTGGQTVGYLGLIDTKISDYFEFKDPLFVAEINLTEVLKKPEIPKSYKKIPKFPPVIEDLSIIVAQALEMGDILEIVEKEGKPLLSKAKVIDVYSDEKLGEDKKSVTVRLYFQKPNEMPAQDEVSQARGRIISALENTYRAKVRK